MSVLQIKLLGGFAVHLGDQPVTGFRSAKARALLAYLAAQPDQDHARTTLATLLWGNLPEAAAKTNLRIELSNLNKLLAAHPALEISRSHARLHSRLASLDVREFHVGVATFLALPIETQGAQLLMLVRAIDHYQGEFLAGFQTGDAFEFEEWQLLTQEQLHEQAMGALNLLQQRYAEQGSWAELAVAARRQLALVPWQESAHRNLIQALATQGQRAAALEQYDRCCAVLQAELGIEPAAATQEIAARLRADPPARSVTQSQMAHHNLAQPLKSLIGRRTEIEQLYEMLLNERLVTLLGLGGVGKSRLAQAVAQRALLDFGDGVWFVSLTNIEANDTALDRIALAIAATIGFAITDLQAPWAELTVHLARQDVLLILDNWEHLVMVAESVFDQLLGNTRVHILATSRVRLMVEGEQLFPLTGLSLTAAHALFVERARRVVPSFTGVEHAAVIDKICAEVGGLPLGIELAASWVEHIPVAEIGRSLAEIAIEPEQADTFVERHQTLHSVFEYSWRLLNPPQQQILARFSAFRGGFDRTAASAVAGSTLSDLSMLLAHSLVQRVTAGRYDLHPLVQEYSAGKVTQSQTPALFAAHSQYYLTLLISQARAKRTALLLDFDNIRSAWQRAVQGAHVEMVEQATLPFGEWMTQFGLMADGNQLFADAVDRFYTLPQQDDELVAHLLDQQAVFVRSLHGLRAVSSLQQRVLTLTKNHNLQTRAHLDLANHHAEQGEWAQADFHFDKAEALAQLLPDQAIYISTVEERIHINAIHFRGDFAQGIARLEELLRLFDTATTPICDAENLRFRVLQSLPILAIRYRDYGLAIRYAQQALDRAQQIAHRRRECDILLDLALAEQFAGLYAQAIGHNQAALAIAEEIGDTDQMALLKANLCLTLRQQGALEAALAYGQTAIEGLRTLGNRRIEGQARNRVGHTLLALKRWTEAAAAYAEALTVWEPLQHPNRYEAVAGRAVAAFQLGNTDEALNLVNEVLDFVAAKDLVGIVEPVLLLLNCATVLSACGGVTQSEAALQRADDWVQTIADRINDEIVRRAFLARPDNQLLYARLTRSG